MRPMDHERSATPSKRRRCFRALLPALLASAFLVGTHPASAASSYTGGLSPTVGGQRADLNAHGAFRAHAPDRIGTYRAKAPERR